MMATWCLPRNLSSAFLDALKSGQIDPAKLMDMASAERRTFFEGIVGKDHAQEVNASFESKMLLKDQQRGYVTWAKKIAGITEQTRADIVSRINKLDRVLDPDEEKDFLADLAAKKLGVSVTADEAKGIFDLSQRAEAARAAMETQRAQPSYETPGLQDAMKSGTGDPGIAYGRAVQDLTDRIESLKPTHMTTWDHVWDILNIPKSALTSVLHFSAPFVQGWGMLGTKQWGQGFGQMIQYFRDEENYRNLNAYISSHPDYPFAVDGKLGLTKLGDKLSAREEAIQSTLVEKASEWLAEKATPVTQALIGKDAPNVVRASSRAFTGYLNFVRFSRFSELLTAARNAGEDIRPGTQSVRDLATVVNNFTGRGALGKGDEYAQVSPALNAMFFSPRKISATIQMFNPYEYARLTPTARMGAMRQLTGTLIATGSVLALARAVGATVNWDPRSSDFAKVQIGGEKLDMTGGNSSYVRLWGRILSGQEITSRGKLIDLGQGYKPTTRADLVLQFTRGKLSPVASALADALYGKDPVGRPFSIEQEAQDKLLPITVNDYIHYAQNDPHNTIAILPSLAAIFGVGLESPLPPIARTNRNVWGQSPKESWP